MTKIRFIGDTHGKWDSLKKIARTSRSNIILGDVGIGFKYIDSDGEMKFHSNPPYDVFKKNNVRIIRGNHDNPDVCEKQDYYIKDGTIESIDDKKIMYIGGALSIDAAWRTEGLDWWRNEELSYFELENMIEKYLIEKPDIMCTHDCPEEISILMENLTGRGKLNISSRTRDAFSVMLKFHKPKLWLFGHWHNNIDHVYEGTRFICLDELNYIDIDIEKI